MTTSTRSITKRLDWRRILFTIPAGLVALILLSNLNKLGAPWASLASFPDNDPRLLHPDLHRWHEAMWGAVTGILEGGVLLSLLWRPRAYPLLIQFMAMVGILAALLVLPFEPDLLFVIVVLAVFVAAYPTPRALIDFSRDGPISRPLLAFSAAVALALLPYMARLMFWQIQGVGGEHVTANQWSADVEHSSFLLLALFLASTKRTGWQILSILTGIVFLYLGVAALALPNHAGSWGVTGGIASLIGGALCIVITMREARNVNSIQRKDDSK